MCTWEGRHYLKEEVVRGGGVPQQKEKVKVVEVKLKIRPRDRVLDKDRATYTGKSRS